MPEAVVAPEIPVFTEQTTETLPAETPKASETPATPATAAPAEGEKPTVVPEKPEPGKGKHRFDRRIDRAYKERAEAQARAEFAERQLQELQKPKVSGEPKLEEFDDIEKYAEAKGKFKADQTLREYETKRSQESAKQFHERLISQWDDRIDKAELPEDFHTVVGDLKPISPLNVAIMQSDPKVAHYLGSHLDELSGYGKLDFISQIREVAKLEAKLLAEPVKPKPSKAPAPIKPLTGTADTSGEPDTSNTEAWIKWRTKQVHGKR